MAEPFSIRSIVRTIAVVLLAASFAPGSARGAPELPGADESYAFYSHNQDLREALEFFGKNTGIAVVVDPQVSGTLSDRELRGLSRKAYLEALAAEYGLVWFFDGTTLHVTVSGHVDTEIFSLKAVDGQQVISVLDAVGIYQPKFAHRFDRKNRVFMVSGPPGYVDIVKKTVEALEDAERVEVTIMRGHSDPSASMLSLPNLSSVYQGLESEALQ